MVALEPLTLLMQELILVLLSGLTSKLKELLLPALKDSLWFKETSFMLLLLTRLPDFLKVLPTKYFV